MALQREIKSLPFTEGADTRVDTVLSAKPSRVENAVIRGGVFRKRYGTETLPASLDTGGSLSSGEAIFPYFDELVRLNNGKAYALGQASSQWTTKAGTAPILTHSLTPVVHNSSNQSDFDHATAGNITVTAWVDSGVHVAVYDEVTGTYYQNGATALSGSGSDRGCRCVRLGGTVLVFFGVPSGNVKCAVVNTATPSTAPSVNTLQTDFTGSGSFGGGQCFDAIAYGNNYAIVAYITGTPGSEHWQLFAVSAAGAVLSSPAKTDMGAVSNAGGGNNLTLLLHIDQNGVGYLANAGKSVYYACFNVSTFASVKALTQITGENNLFFAAMAEAAAGTVTVFASSDGTASRSSIFIGKAAVTSSAITSAYGSIPGTAGLAIQSDGFLVNGAPCVVTVNDTSYSGGALTLQPTSFVVDSSGNALARILPGISQASGGGRFVRPFTSSTGATALLVTEQGQTSFTSQSGVVIQTTPHGIARCDLMLSGGSSVPTIQMGGCVYIGGSMPRIYDGKETVEAGHNVFPEGTTVSLGAGGQLSAGAYQWKVVYVWINAKGEYQRSAPSAAITGTATATQAATLTIPTQRLCGRDVAGLSTTMIEVYRTVANGTVFYRISSVSSPTLNNTAAATVSFSDSTVTDAALVSNAILYTTGGVNDCIAPPAYSIACAHKTRLIVAGLDDAYEWRSSSQEIAGEMLRFNEAWGGRVPPETGPITALASMDGNLVIFTQSAAYIVQGDGPDLLGNNSWPDPQLITSVDAGPSRWQAVFSTPEGVFCQTARGWKMLARDLSFVYIGADMEDYGQLIARSGVVRPEYEEIWIQADNGSDVVGQQAGTLVPSTGGYCLVYNYRYRQWSVLTNYGAIGACYYQGKYTRVKSTGAMSREKPGFFTDSGGVYSLLIETPWLRLGSVQGFQRVVWASLVGTYGGDSGLLWETAYSYSGNPTTPTYGATDTMVLTGTGVLTAGGYYEWRRHMRVQKCEAIKFRLSDTNVQGTGEGFAFTELALELGMKSGIYRLPAATTA